MKTVERHKMNQEQALLPEWNLLSQESKEAVRKWFDLGAERLQQILDSEKSAHFRPEGCRHESCDENGICKTCGAKARITLEGLHPDDLKRGDCMDLRPVPTEAQERAEKLSRKIIENPSKMSALIAEYEHEILNAAAEVVEAGFTSSERMRLGRSIRRLAYRDYPRSWVDLKGILYRLSVAIEELGKVSFNLRGCTELWVELNEAQKEARAVFYPPSLR